MVPAPRDPPQIAAPQVAQREALHQKTDTADALEAALQALPAESPDLEKPRAPCATAEASSSSAMPKTCAVENAQAMRSAAAAEDRSGTWHPTAGDDAAGNGKRGSSERFNPLASTESKPQVNKSKSDLHKLPPSTPTYSQAREHAKCVGALIFVLVAWSVIFACLAAISSDFKEPDCKALAKSELASRRTCESCGKGTLVLPLFGEYEQSWPTWVRILLYGAGILCIFMGMGLICDQFMSAIEEITSVEKVVWRVVRDGAKHKFRVKVWNPTIANLTLMALGSSAPEILLSSTELIGQKYFAGSLGPSTIVGSAAFNLFCISAVCVSAIPPPETRIIVGYGTFMVTALVSLLAYIWLLIILMVITPKKVDLLEGVVTLLLFPVFLSVAFAADKGWGCFRTVPTSSSHNEKVLSKCKSKMIEQFGTVVDTLPPETLKLLMSAKTAMMLNPQTTHTKAAHRKLVTGKMTGGLTRLHRQTSNVFRQRSAQDYLTVGFAEDKHVIFENVGTLEMQVILSCAVDNWVRMHYETREGTAKRGVRYRHVEGNITFSPGCTSQWISVPIIDDEEWEPQEEFYVALSDLRCATTKKLIDETESMEVSVLDKAEHPPAVDTIRSSATSSRSRVSSNASIGNIYWRCQVTTVTVLNDDFPGTLDFDTDEVLAHEGDIVTLGVCRTAGSAGTISCKYETLSDSALEGKDFEPAAGTLTFQHGETHKEISVKVIKSVNHKYEDDERFRLKLFDASEGVVFDKLTAGGETAAFCDVIISSGEDLAPANLEEKFMRALSRCIDLDRWSVGMDLWRQHARDSLMCCGSMADQAEAGMLDWVCHAVSLIWKVLFVLVPPPILCNGWLCFGAALLMIGVVTAFAGDVASLLGCCIGIPDDITAITLVALGTSLPDTLASRAAAMQDQYADNAIGNVTGSNSVNVFLGIGISWTIGAAYWQASGPTSEWKEHTHNDIPFKNLYLPDHERGGFFVPTDTLAFSVIAYVCGAFCTLAVLRYRRVRFGGELGGPQFNQYVDSSMLFTLWIIYVISVSLYASTV